MDQIKNLVKKYFSNFAYFYHFLHSKILVSIGLSIIMSVLDAFGLSMFLPLLQMVDDASTIDSTSMGNLHFLIDGIEALGIQLTLGFVLLFMILFFVIKGLIAYLGMIYSITLQQFFIKKIRVNLINTLNQISFKSFMTTHAGRIQNTLSGEVSRVTQAYDTYFAAFQHGIMVLVYIGFAFFINIQFAILVSIGGIITNLLFKVIYKHTKNASRKLTFSNNIYQGQIIQYVGNFKYLRSTGMVSKYATMLKNTIDKIESSRKKIGVLASIGSATREPLLIIVVALVIFIQTNLLGGEMGTILISLLFFYRALNALAYMQQQWNSFMSVSGSLENMQNFQNEMEGEYEENGNLNFNQLESSIELRNIGFSYDDTNILKDINLVIPKNQSIAFVGESGSGKTTLVNLVSGLLFVDKGSVTIDGISIKELDKTSYQKRIGYITQEPVIFNDTIYNNVTFWADPTPENQHRFEKVIQQASLETFIKALPNGKETELGNNGINLSGGQKQRISIARELFKDIDILIMDEATSALDSETELEIRNSIDTLQGQYTLLIVAHRLSSIRNVDRVVFMNNGKIEEEGNFITLMEKYPRFKKMAELQKL